MTWQLLHVPTPKLHKNLWKPIALQLSKKKELYSLRASNRHRVLLLWKVFSSPFPLEHPPGLQSSISPLRPLPVTLSSSSHEAAAGLAAQVSVPTACKNTSTVALDPKKPHKGRAADSRSSPDSSNQPPAGPGYAQAASAAPPEKGTFKTRKPSIRILEAFPTATSESSPKTLNTQIPVAHTLPHFVSLTVFNHLWSSIWKLLFTHTTGTRLQGNMNFTGLPGFVCGHHLTYYQIKTSRPTWAWGGNERADRWPRNEADTLAWAWNSAAKGKKKKKKAVTAFKMELEKFINGIMQLYDVVPTEKQGLEQGSFSSRKERT